MTMETLMTMTPVCKYDDVPEGEVLQAHLPDGRALAIYKVEGQIYATDDLCTHGEASLSLEGTLNGKIIECSWHFGSFDITSGAVEAMPCTMDLKTYKTEVVDGVVHVDA